MKRLGIIGGAGLLGSTMAFQIAMKGLVDEIVLIDIKENHVKSHVMDMDQSMSELTNTKIIAGEWESLAKCDVIIMTASRPHVKVQSRNEFLKANLDIVINAAEKIKKYCTDAVVINATAPVDVYNYIFYKIIGFDRKKFIGFNRNDSLRLRWAVGKVFDVNPKDVFAIVIGEHGETQVPLYNMIEIKGKKVTLSAKEINEIDFMIKNWFNEFNALDVGRTTGWTSSTSMGELLSSIIAEGDMPTCGSAILEDEYGVSGLSIGVPLKTNKHGWKEIIELDLTKEERDAFEHSAKTIKSLISECGF